MDWWPSVGLERIVKVWGEPESRYFQEDSRSLICPLLVSVFDVVWIFLFLSEEHERRFLKLLYTFLESEYKLA